MRRLVVLIVLVVTTMACAKGYTYKQIEPDAEDFAGAQSICESYYAPPWYYVCGAFTRYTCQRYQLVHDRCMEKRGWERTD